MLRGTRCTVGTPRKWKIRALALMLTRAKVEISRVGGGGAWAPALTLAPLGAENDGARREGMTWDAAVHKSDRRRYRCGWSGSEATRAERGLLRCNPPETPMAIRPVGRRVFRLSVVSQSPMVPAHKETGEG